MNYKNNIIAVDFDGTLCENRWPEIGEPNEDLITYLKERQKNGDKIILWTCRVGDMLEDAVEWASQYGLIFDAVNENLSEIVEAFGSDTRKVFANEYIDDRAFTTFELPYIKRKIDGCVCDTADTCYDCGAYGSCGNLKDEH